MDNRIDGAVLVLFDVATDLGSDGQARARAIVDSVRDPLVVLDASRRVRFANRAFEALVERDGDLEGERFESLGQWDSAGWSELERLLASSGHVDDLELGCTQDGQRTHLRVKGRALGRTSEDGAEIVLAFEKP